MLEKYLRALMVLLIIAFEWVFLAFIGMCSTEVAPTGGFTLWAGIIAGLLQVLSKSLFMGVGGKLGVLAFGSFGISCRQVRFSVSQRNKSAFLPAPLQSSYFRAIVYIWKKLLFLK